MCGGSAPAPDPNVGQAAQSESQLSQDEFSDYQKNFEPVQVQAANNNLAAQQFSLSQAQKYSDQYDATTGQALKSFHSDVQNFNTDSYRESLAGQAGGDAQQAFAMNEAGLHRNEQARGINTGSAASLWADRDMASQSSLAQTQAMNSTRMAAMQMGWGLKAQDAGLGAGAGGYGLSATNGAIGAGSALAGSNGGLSSATGSALQGYGLQAQAGNYNNQFNEGIYGERQSMYGSLVGAGGSMGAAAIAAMF